MSEPTVSPLDADTDTPVPESQTLKKARDAIAEQLEKELRGAWRAGYSYVHIYSPTLGDFDSDATVTIKKGALPSDSKEPPRRCTGEWVYRYSYDIDAVSDDKIRRAVRGELDRYEANYDEV
jgi:hypothetical protein